MKCPSFQRALRWFSFIISLVILVSTTQVQSGLAAPQWFVPRAGELKLITLYNENHQLCLDQKEKFVVLVINGRGVPIPGVTVHANNKTIITGPTGYARWYELADKLGQKTITIYATKNGYFKTLDKKATFEVIDCIWNLRMDYNEEFLDNENTWVFQGSVEIEDTPFTANTDGALFLMTGQPAIQAQYHGTLFDLIKPISCSPQPALEGPYEIQFSGEYKDGFLWINLSAVPVALPSTVMINCVTLDPNYTVDPFKYPTGQKLDLIKQAQLTEIFCSGDGCVKRFKLSRVQLWPFNTANFASGILIIEREKK
ncbi:MAG: hypothetical protein A2X25_02735 [Chloroflexi bacterium GWB2_49_20]|nr:MAG: hypothetical protein A2X25_02735 [Chloroflexi bacterium GWB2_49_20]OGN78777.1 MAG: hypothetical protein A2X26_13045 [Chloroflexi bacterium GWC2_49_37]OGN85853.1 MAG: hypothetical protein A2X27_11640 [Chloroflexi bacterium GWD2_49_16]